MRVAIGDVDATLAHATAERLGPGAKAYALDVTDADLFEAFIDAAEDDLGQLHSLVNNAGIMPTGPFSEETREATQRMIDININGVINGVRLIVPRFTARGSGHLINVASVAGVGGYPGIATYCGTKHFVVGFSSALRHELKGTGVEISVVLPGFVATELTSGLGTSRFYKMIGPDDVAAGVLQALSQPRFEVFVPKALGPMGKGLSVLPRRVQDVALRATRGDRLALEADHAKRAAYELRVAQSAPALLETSDELR
jgi:NADP-dependent 3-hydroxy acid dehydrogenase YdfG